MEFKHLKNRFYSWEELEKYIKDLKVTKEKGDAFEEFAYLYFISNKDLYDIKEIYSESEIPEELRNKYKLENSDYGVDGLIITNDNKSIGYQVKFRSDNSSATYSELATFWAESEYCDRRCIFSNCLQLPNQSEKKKNQFQILLDTFLTLTTDFFEKIYCIANSTPVIEREKHKPRDYQTIIIKDVLEGFKTYDRGKIICACGTGKTLTALWIKEELKAEKTLFVVPSLALIRQTLVEWKKQANIQFEHLVVCSDKTVTENNGEIILEHTSSSNIPVTTDPEDINKFLNNESNQVIFSTYQSLDKVSAALIDKNFSFDLTIFDEAHRTAGTNDSEMFGLGLNDRYIKSTKRLFMTATERIVSPKVKRLAQESDYTIFSMDDELVYGPVFSKLDFGTAIEKGIISDYKVILAAVNSSELPEQIESRNLFTTNGEDLIDLKITLKQFILAKAIKNLNIEKIISYHTTIEQSKKFVFGSNNIIPFKDLLYNVMNFDDKKEYFSHVNGSMSSAIKTKIFNEFKKADISLMTNVSCLTEGVDIPTIDAVYFVEPKQSIVDIIQAIGRALRKTKNKEQCSYIILPLIVSDDITDFSQIDPQSFDTLHNVIQALRDQDSILSDEIDVLNLSYARQTKHSNNLGGHLGVWVPQNINLSDFSEALSLRIATVNKNSSLNSLPQIQLVVDRTSSFTRVFRTIGDYNIDAYSSLVIPTIEKFATPDDIKTTNELMFNHNNVSHTEKIGLIQAIDDKKYILTELGKKFKNGIIQFNDLFKRQTLKYYEFNDNTTSVLFPYRSFLKVMKEFDKISRLEFIYSIYTLKGSTKADILNSINIIKDIRDSFPNIEILSEDNKKKVLAILNLKYDTTFNYGDIWTSRTTAYNQFNYFKRHTQVYGNIFSGNSSEITKIENGNEKIDELLSLDQNIENLNIEELKEYYIK